MTADTFRSERRDGSSAARKIFGITPNDSEDLEAVAKIYVGGEGSIRVTAVDGGTETFTNCQGILPVEVSRVHATGTTATDIIGIY